MKGLLKSFDRTERRRQNKIEKKVITSEENAWARLRMVLCRLTPPSSPLLAATRRCRQYASEPEAS